MPMLVSCRKCHRLQAKALCDACGAQQKREWKPQAADSPYRSAAWKKLARDCKQRDGHRCVRCGDTSGLVAHHLNPVKWGFPVVCPLSDLVTLCAKCHSAAEAALQEEAKVFQQ